jgi:hypothetical protein
VSLRGDIRECQEYAEACTHIAACIADAKTRDDILRLKRSWLSLAKCLALLPPQSNFNRPANGSSTPVNGKRRQLPPQNVRSLGARL